MIYRYILYAINWFIAGTLGGLLLALEIDLHGRKLGGRKILWIALGWGTGFGAGAGLGRAFEELSLPILSGSIDALQSITGTLPWTSFGLFTGLIAGAVGSWITFKISAESDQALDD